MPVKTETTSTNGKGAIGARRQAAAPSLSSIQRHRQVPWIVAGVLLVVGCALAFGVASLRVSAGEEVLALARPVPAGQTVEPSDLRIVKVTPTSGLDPVTAADESSAVGRPAAVPLVAGTLLTRGDLGSSSTGSGDFDVVAVGLKAGAYPPSLGPGDPVEVVPVVGDSSSGSAPVTGSTSSVRAVVVAVETAPAGSSADAVISLQVVPSSASDVATLAAAGQVALVGLPSGS